MTGQPKIFSWDSIQAFLDEADKTVSFQRTTNILILENA
jgi:hypothetical protein